jgi:hypothetical protein
VFHAKSGTLQEENFSPKTGFKFKEETSSMAFFSAAEG